MYRVIRCINENVHHLKDGEGKILGFLGKDGIVIRCSDRRCKSLNYIKIRIPGLTIDLTKAGIEIEQLPRNERINAEKAASIITG